MIGWFLGGMALGALLLSADANNCKKENNKLREENITLKLTINNQSKLLHDYDVVNNIAKKYGYPGCVPFFYKLAEQSDEIEPYARFLYKVRCIRNDIAHPGEIYMLSQGFMNKLRECRLICEEIVRRQIYVPRYRSRQIAYRY